MCCLANPSNYSLPRKFTGLLFLRYITKAVESYYSSVVLRMSRSICLVTVTCGTMWTRPLPLSIPPPPLYIPSHGFDVGTSPPQIYQPRKSSAHIFLPSHSINRIQTPRPPPPPSDPKSSHLSVILEENVKCRGVPLARETRTLL